jgi:GDP-L-fucose synthase
LDNKVSIYIAGHKGMLGSAIKKVLEDKGFTNLITASSKELDLTDQNQVNEFFEQKKPEYVVLAAAKVGGINANILNPGVFLYDNMMIQNNVIHASWKTGVKKMVFPGSSCIYPKECPQPMKEEYLLTGKLEPTNEGYALAKIAGLKLLQNYYKQYGFQSISLMPCNLYGPNDSFDLEHSHVLSALVKRFSDATASGEKDVTLWGTGVARREFMHVNDAAEGMFYMLLNYHSVDFINIGWGEDISIKDLAGLIALKTGYKGEIKWDDTKPNGMLRKCMDVSKMKSLGFFPKISLEQGVVEMINLYQKLKK